MTTKSHYESHTAESYESAYFYQKGAYTDYLRTLVQKRLQLGSVDAPPAASQRVLLDIGGGTGTFTRMLVQGISVQAVVVDPFLEKQSIDNKDHDANVSFVAEPAEAFLGLAKETDTWRRNGFDQVLLKEVAHHLADADRVGIFRGMYQDLRPTTETTSYPSLLIITRPQTDIDYPLWDEARSVWARNQPALQQFVSELEEAGFSNVLHSMEAYSCEIPLARWQTMVKSRFWSTFANFTDDELVKACETIAMNEKDRIDNNGTLRFQDRLLFISAYKI
jgi:SAM-dependent methyltransferase